MKWIIAELTPLAIASLCLVVHIMSCGSDNKRVIDMVCCIVALLCFVAEIVILGKEGEDDFS